MSKTIYMVVGSPGSGKTWVCDQLKDKFQLIHHDGYIHLKAPGSYVKAILEEAPKATKPVLIEAPFSISQTKEPLEAAGYKVIPVFIVEEDSVHRKRYAERERKNIPQGHLTRTQTYLQRAKEGKHFFGTSEQVLKHLQSV
jgi:hypothetical protein